MAKQMVGLARNIKRRWLDKTIDFMEETENIDELKDTINEYLRFEITSKDNIRKTRELLLAIWNRKDENSFLKKEALTLIRKYPDDALAYHWVLMLNTFPVFCDVCNAIGGISEFQDSFSLEQITKQLYLSWGERATLFHAVPKIMQTLKDFKVLTSNGKGIYQISRTEIKNGETICFLLYAAMHADGKAYYTIDELQNLRILFPFQYTITNELLNSYDKFVIHNTGGSVAVSVKHNLET